MKLDKYKKYSLVIISIFVLSIILVFFVPNIIYLFIKDNVDQTNQLISNLSEDPVDTNPLSSISNINIFEKYSTVNQLIQNEINKDDILAKEKEIQEDIARDLNEFANTMRSYQDIDTSFLPESYNSEDIDISLENFEEVYISEIKTQFKSALDSSTLIYEKNPEIEVMEMSIQEQVAQLFVLGIQGTSLSQEEVDFLSTYKIGGVLVFSKNINNQDQLKTLSSSLQSTNTKNPLFVAVDQEGGIVKRINWDQTASHKQIGSQNTDAQCEQWRTRANNLYESGINLNFGLIGDFTQNKNSYIYPRTFSDDLASTSSSIKSAIDCNEKSLLTVKHYPGHGGTDVDTHKLIGNMKYNSESDWLSSSAQPFSAAIEQNVDSIMIGHLVSSWLDAQPATLSKPNIDYLRENLGYDGLVITDDLNMLTAVGISHEESIVQAFEAGNDILLLNSSNVDHNKNLINLIVSEVENSQELKESLNQSVKRILEKKNIIIRNQENYIPSNLVY